jgi:hypothetical protein
MSISKWLVVTLTLSTKEKGVEPNDTIIFDSISIMSRNVKEVLSIYEKL